MSSWRRAERAAIAARAGAVRGRLPGRLQRLVGRRRALDAIAPQNAGLPVRQPGRRGRHRQDDIGHRAGAPPCRRVRQSGLLCRSRVAQGAGPGAADRSRGARLHRQFRRSAAGSLVLRGRPAPAARARLLRARHRGRSGSRGGAVPQCAGGPYPGDEPRAVARRGRDCPSRRAAGAADAEVGSHGGRSACRVVGAAPDATRGGQRLHGRAPGRSCRRRRRDLPPARRQPAGNRARGQPADHLRLQWAARRPRCRRDPGLAGPPPRSPAPDAGGNARLELPAAVRCRAARPCPSFRLRRRLHDAGGGSRGAGRRRRAIGGRPRRRGARRQVADRDRIRSTARICTGFSTSRASTPR